MQRKAKEKILVVRLSSIGDIVLTTPILRSLRACKPQAEIHFLTKKAFSSLLVHNPNVDRVISFEGDLKATIKLLQSEGYTAMLDLHQNTRSRILRFKLGVPTKVFPKDRLKVLFYTKFRVGELPKRHTVDRYAVALGAMGCKLDAGRLEFYLPEEAPKMAAQILAQHFDQSPYCIALGGNFATKRWPREYFVELIRALGRPAVLLGGPAEREDAKWIAAQVQERVFVAAGEYDLLLSAAIMKQCSFAITHDSGFMHIATAFSMPLFAIWGSTVEGLGFTPYRAPEARILQVAGLSCRPCSKLGYDACPKGHFKCMRDLHPAMVLQVIQRSGVLEK